jgi:hypothetical protein
MTPERFAVATLEELWSGGVLLERRLSHGQAIQQEGAIVADDTRDDALAEGCVAALDAMRAYVLPEARMRLIAEATGEGLTRTITVTLSGLSIVTSPEHLERDLETLRQCLPRGGAETAPGGVPLLWKNGSGALLLHEAAGHPLEHGHADAQWPSWLHIDTPLAMRRATFRDVPLLRMTTVAARQTGAPFSLPAERIEVLLVDGGSFEPLTDVVTLRIAAAELVRGGEAVRLAPFELVDTRTSIAQSVRGGYGDPIRYPGVICSREGQELVVGSYAPLLLTEHR